MSTHAQDERRECVEAMRAVGPDAPTLCGEWTTRDLAAHLVIREGRPDAALGILIPRFSRHEARVRQSYRKRDFGTLLARVAAGAPRWNPMSISAIDAQINLAEYFVHCEDVRRAGDSWEPRMLPESREQALWTIAQRMGRFLFRSSKGGVTLHNSITGEAVAAVDRPDTVTLVGKPSELVLYAFGRTSVAQVQLEGSAEAIAAFRRLRLHV